MAAKESGFEIVDHTADVAIRGWASSLEALFTSMAQGLFEVIGEDVNITATQSRTLHLEAETREELLHDWLETLNALHQIHHELYTQFDIKIEANRLQATIRGGSLDQASNALGTEVKAVTWHDLAVQDTPEGLNAYVLLDI